MKLYIACSFSKKPVLQAKALDLYAGALFNAGKDVADLFGWQIVILSAKYGFIDPDKVIETYDLRMKKPYEGEWPMEPGWYLGGPNYFRNAPTHIKPLVPAARIGEMVNYVNLLKAGLSREEIFATHTKGKPRGIVQSIYQLLKQNKFSKEELYQQLIKEHGETPSIRKTIQAQVSQARIGKEKKCQVHRDGDKYWITSDFDFYSK